eukprot:1110426-Pleurochrysis_carterae.AAC.1
MSLSRSSCRRQPCTCICVGRCLRRHTDFQSIAKRGGRRGCAAAAAAADSARLRGGWGDRSARASGEQ